MIDQRALGAVEAGIGFVVAVEVLWLNGASTWSSSTVGMLNTPVNRRNILWELLTKIAQLLLDVRRPREIGRAIATLLGPPLSPLLLDLDPFVEGHLLNLRLIVVLAHQKFIMGLEESNITVLFKTHFALL